MGTEEVLAKLRADKSVKAAFPLNGEIYDIAVGEEMSIKESSMGMPLVNRALEEMLRREFAVCIFCDGDFDPPMDHVIVMEDGAGNRIGHDIPKCMAGSKDDDPNAFWLCDDFVIYPEKAGTDETVMVLLPQDVTTVGNDEGVKNAIVMYPATTTDMILKRHFGISGKDITAASAILAFDLI
ncbi:MAG: hypothetical protein FWH44_02915 [Methanomassiliicoccaceae archaeon]|nr:hypothetical protein [Methanomassiliicoccaceae archaeon]